MMCPRCKRELEWVEVRIHGGEPMRPREGFEYAECNRCGFATQRSDAQLELGELQRDVAGA